MFHYDLCGIILASELTLPSLEQVAGVRRVDADVRFRKAPLQSDASEISWLIHRERPGFQAPVMSTGVSRGGYVIRFHETADFWISADGSQIELLTDDSDVDLIEHLLVDQVVPQVLHLRGQTTLHGSCVALGGRALAFLGQSGAGKSTMAAAFVPPGELVDDDCLALALEAGELMAAPSYASVRLRNDAAGIRAAGEILPAVSARLTWKRRLRLPLVSRAVRLHRLYVLGVSETPQILRCTRAEAFGLLVHHVHRLLPDDPASLLREFDLLTELTSRVPIRRLDYPRSFARLDEVIALIQGDLDS